MFVNKKGETLLEVIIAIGVMAAVFSSIATATMRISNVGYSSKNREQAVKIVQETVEKIYTIRDTDRCRFFDSAGLLKYMSINNLNQLDESTATDGWENIEELFSIGGDTSAINPQRQIMFKDISYAGGTAREVTVSIRWNNKGMPEEQTYKLKTLITDWRSL